MSDEAKQQTPAYATYKSFYNLINDLRENGMPPHIMYSVVKGSNSGKATMLASLKSLGLVTDDKIPTEAFKKLVEEKENYKSNLKQVLMQAYPFLFDGSIDLSNTTTEMVANKFKDAGAGGSTISKGMSFFLGAAKEAGIAVSSRVKPALSVKPNGSRKKSSNKSANSEEAKGSTNTTPQVEDVPPDGTEKISFTLRGMPDVVVYFPAELEDEDEIKRVIRATVFNLEMYYGVQINEV